MAGSSPLKEKVVVYYEGLFQKDSKDPPWPEFWMLEPNAIWLERTIGTATTEELLKRRNVIAKLVSQAVATLAGKNGHFRRLNAAWTLSIVFANVFSKSWSNFAFDILQLLTASLGDADVLFPALAKELDAMLSGTDRSLKLAAVNLLLVTIAGNTTLNQQPLTEYFFAKTNLLGGLLGVIGDPETDFALSVRSTVALGLLANFRKGEINNLYSNGLTTLVGEDEDSLPLQAALLTFYELISSNARFLSAMLQEAEKFSGTKREMAFARLALIIVSLLLENTDSIALLYDANARFTVDICRSKPPTVPKRFWD
ncbi:hypothetical protein DFJ74DRAFT_703570 [Hyaloraphidium curvatum]|nr:hypothetical protein DFJ74DRAFT_703570 [Hyaloraphidium curvatum]